MNRRKFIKNSFITSLLPLSPGISFAQGLKRQDIDHFFVQILVPGGMDVTLSLNPLTHDLYKTDQNDIFLEYRPNEILQFKDLKLGPACESLKPYMHAIAAINGIVMRRDVGHDNLLAYAGSGSGDGSTPFLSIEAEHFLPSTSLGTLINSSLQKGNRKPIISQVKAHSNRSNSVTSFEETMALKNFYERTQSILQRESKNMLTFNFEKKDFYSRIDSLPKDREDQSIPIIAAAFLENIATAALLDVEDILTYELDTHSNHEGNHLTSQKTVWSFVADMFKTFEALPYKDSSLFDHTTFVVMSEFSRTPYRNAAYGKDHNVYTNSVLVAGGRVNGAKSFGDSKVISRFNRSNGKALHIGSPFDYQTGLVTQVKTPHTSLIFPENVIRSFAPLFPEDFYSSLKDVPSIKGLFR